MIAGLLTTPPDLVFVERHLQPLGTVPVEWAGHSTSRRGNVGPKAFDGVKPEALDAVMVPE